MFDKVLNTPLGYTSLRLSMSKQVQPRSKLNSVATVSKNSPSHYLIKISTRPSPFSVVNNKNGLIQNDSRSSYLSEYISSNLLSIDGPPFEGLYFDLNLKKKNVTSNSK